MLENIPTEILVKIFSYVCPETLLEVERVCTRLSSVIIDHFWAKTLIKWIIEDPNLKYHYEKAGWTQMSSNSSLSRKLYLKTYNLMTSDDVKVAHCKFVSLRNSSMMKYTQEKVAGLVAYKNKIFLALKNCSVESRILPDFRLTNVVKKSKKLEGEPTNFLDNFPISLSGILLGALEPQIRKLFLYNADSEELIITLDVTSFGLPYDLKINSTNIIVLADWCLNCWKVDSAVGIVKPNRTWSCIPDFTPVSEFMNWLPHHSLEVNNDYVVTCATRQRTGEDINSCQSFIHVRRSGCDGYLGSVLYPETEQELLGAKEIQRIKLSSKNLLAVLQADDDGKQVGYFVHILDVSTGNGIYQLPRSESLFSSVIIPVQWTEDNLYFQVVPSNNCWDAFESDDCYCVQIKRWNSKTKKIQNLNGPSLKNSADLLHIYNSAVVKVAHKFPEVILSELDIDERLDDSWPTIETQAFYYDLWCD